MRTSKPSCASFSAIAAPMPREPPVTIAVTQQLLQLQLRADQLGHVEGVSGQVAEYEGRAGDTLWDIARVKLGNGTKWQSIYNLNKAAIEAAAKKYGRSSSSNGWWIYPGTVLKLPS